MFVFDNYPDKPPEFMAANIQKHGEEQRFLHMNISENGHVCMLANQ